jgi:hypothetical protein
MMPSMNDTSSWSFDLFRQVGTVLLRESGQAASVRGLRLVVILGRWKFPGAATCSGRRLPSDAVETSVVARRGRTGGTDRTRIPLMAAISFRSWGIAKAVG